MKTIYIKILGIHCDNCRNKISSTLIKIKNIKDIKFNKNIAIIKYTGDLNKEQIISSIKKIDYYTQEDYITDDINKLKSPVVFKEIFLTLSIILIFLTIYFKLGYKIPVISEKISYPMLFITGLLTSIHCIGMCGAINLFATFNNNEKYNLKKPIAYNLGRLISYSIIGGLVGLLGKVLSINNKINGLIIIVASIVMLLMSLKMLNIINFKNIKLFNLNKNFKPKKFFLIGLLNGLMPCGPMQAMQIYALQSGSFLKGFLSMFLFCLGTIPLMLFIGTFSNFFKGKKRIIINKISAILIMTLSILMFFRGLNTYGVNFKIFDSYKNYTKSSLKNDYQEIEFDLDYNNYKDIVILRNIPVKMIINVKEEYLNGCNNEIIINEYNIKKHLEAGKNVIEFTPTKTGEFQMNCWMNMIENKIKVIDDENYFREES